MNHQHVLDARSGVHLPGPYGIAPYTVIRSRTVQPITTSTAGQHVVMGVCPFSMDSFRGGFNYCQVIGGWGVGGNAPSTSINLISDTIVKGFTTGQVSLGLHAITVEIQCSGTATTSEGIFYAGTLVGRPYRAGYGTWNDLATALTGRREMRSTGAYQTLGQPKRLCTFPVDITEWNLMQDFANTDVVTLSNNNAKDTLGTIAIVWLPTTTAVTYYVTISCEWRVIYHNDLQLASTHVSHPPGSPTLWKQITDVASSEGGHILEGGAAAGATFGAIASSAGEALGVARGGQLAGLVARYGAPLLGAAAFA